MGNFAEMFNTPLLQHIRNRLKRLEKETSAVACMQFADHPEGLSMVIRLYVPASEKEFAYPDVIIPVELNQINRQNENARVDVLFDAIHEALESIQVVQDKSGGLIHH